MSSPRKGSHLSPDEPERRIPSVDGFPDSPPSTSQTFEDLGLAEWLIATCKDMGIRRPTPVQCACIPAVLSGKNVMGIAQTGSGKTAAFALPLLQLLSRDPFGVFALVLTPTRELALQISEQFSALGSSLSLRVSVVIGGAEMTAQSLQLAKRPHIVIATPGRLVDHLGSDGGGVKAALANLRFLVLDEADRLLDSGFEREIGEIFAALPPKRRTLLFSATMTTNLQALQDVSSSCGDDLFRFEAYSGFHTVQSLDQRYLFIPANVKDVYLFYLLEYLSDSYQQQQEAEEKQQQLRKKQRREKGGKKQEEVVARLEARSIIVFTATCKACHTLSTTLTELGVPNAALHSLSPQRTRLSSLSRFKSGQVPVLVATDVAGRGLDIPTVDLVINYDVPRFTRDYVHRVGRTARAGRGGCAISLVTQYDVRLVQGIETLLERKLEEHTVEEEDVLKRITKVFKARSSALLKISESGFDDLVTARKEAKAKSRGQQPGSATGGGIRGQKTKRKRPSKGAAAAE